MVSTMETCEPLNSRRPSPFKVRAASITSGFSRYFTEATTYFSQITIEEGAKNQLWAACVDKSKIVSGEYYEPVHRRKSGREAARGVVCMDRQCHIQVLNARSIIPLGLDTGQ